MIRKIALYGLALLITFLLPSKSVGQDLIEFNSTGANLNQSISDQFTLYETDKETSINEFIANKSDFKGVRTKRSLANLDFTDSYFFLSFELINSLNEKLNLVLETARPITNDVQLFDVESLETFHSGDAIPFKAKDLEINISAFKLVLLPNQKKEFVLKLHSDGESLVIPMIFREQSQFDEVQRQNQLVFGLFIGIFLFTIIIYSAFYALLRDRLFLVYVIYVFFSGLPTIRSGRISTPIYFHFW